jgi:hypothetical protein
LPPDWVDYLSEDEQGNPESFVQEVLSAKNAANVKHFIQYIEDNQRMQALKRRIIEAAEEFDKSWMRESRTLEK